LPLLCRLRPRRIGERLKALVASGASVVRAAAALKRKMHSVRDHARKLGTPFLTISAARKKLADEPSNLRR
jgi:orotate phosphoribosyltransferase